MPDQQTAEEAQNSHIDKMGEHLGKVFHALWQELAWVNMKWAEYVELFGTKESRVILLNNSAPQFFRIVQDTLWEDTILHIARLTDSPVSVGKDNLTIRRLEDLVDHPETKNKVKQLAKVALSDAEFCRDWRHRYLAHKDLQLALKEGARPLAAASRANVRQALTSIGAVLNAVNEHYMDTTTFFDSPIHSGGAEQLLYVLDDGLRAEEERMTRLKRREMLPDDFAKRDL